MSEQKYLIRKGGYYYQPNAQGYTTAIFLAGRYTLEEAIAYSHPNGPDGPRDGISYEPAPVRQPQPDTRLERAREIVKRFYPEMPANYSGRRVQIALAAMDESQ